MIDAFEGILKGFGVITRICLENGIWDISIKKPGKAILKIFWPPFWLKKIEYNGLFLILTGLIFWLVVAYGFYYVFIKIGGL